VLTYRLRAKVWLYDGAAAWHFATLPKGPAGEIRRLAGAGRKGWGSIPVEATLGSTTWRTSLFPDSKSGSYLLPIKASVRSAEGVEAGSTVALTLKVEP
jgi:hypothetical protein